MKTYGEPLPGVEIITHVKYKDDRGNFCEMWNTSYDKMRGTYRQLNIATSKYNVLRGMHRQNQSKLVMPIQGKIFDVALEPETGKWFGVELDDTNALFIPPEYAHGYMVLSKTSIVQYIVDAPYNKTEEETFNWNKYNIEWPLIDFPILSSKDAK
jgi:dTDP-4-dehydrorhamnose 3,5-epimerase